VSIAEKVFKVKSQRWRS